MQGVLVFASSAARAAAVTSPQEGQYSYLKDTNSTEYYDGAAWIAAPIGDITGVTAGTGISGGGTSGTVTITNSMATEITAKGDLIAGTGSATFDNLAVGTNGQTLVADSTASTGLKWATPAATTPTYVGASIYATNVTTSFVQYADNILAFANENFDTDAFHDNSTNNSRITIPTGKGGKYLITAWVRSDTNISDAFTPILLRNGSRYTGSGDGILYGGFLSSQSGLTQSTAPLAVWGTAVVALSAADYIQLAVNTRQATFNCNHYAQLGATFLGA
jgi:hypothetical protein